MAEIIEKLKEAVRQCANAHSVEFCDWKEDAQVAVKSESVPVVADMMTICEAFFGSHQCLEIGWGYTTIMYDETPPLPEINKELLMMALPTGTVI